MNYCTNIYYCCAIFYNVTKEILFHSDKLLRILAAVRVNVVMMFLRNGNVRKLFCYFFPIFV